MASKVTKTLRKSRRPRINLGTTRGAPQFEPSDQCWKDFEVALDRAIPDAVRRGLTASVQSYFDSQPFETSAPFVDDVQNYIAEIRSGTLALKASLRKQGQTEKTVRLILGRRSRIRGTKPGLDQMDMLNHVLTSLIRSTTEANKVCESNAGFVEGDPWNGMIREIRDLFRSSHLPHGAPQDASKSKTGRSSKFVEFIIVLQKNFPEPSFRRHCGISAFSLAKQINRAAPATAINRDNNATADRS